MRKTNFTADRSFFKQLDEPEGLLRLFEFLPNAYLYVKDQQGRFVAMNACLAKLHGYSAKELLGKTDHDIHPAFWAQRYQLEDRQVIESGEEIPRRIWLVPQAHGSLGTFVSSKIPLWTASGSIVGVAGIMYRIDSENGPQVGDPNLQAAVETLENNYAQPLKVDELARLSSLSVSQFARRFRAQFHMPPSEYLQRVRVIAACRHLSSSTASVGQISLEVGFFDQAHFTRTFRKWMSATPTDYRHAHANRTPPIPSTNGSSQVVD